MAKFIYGTEINLALEGLISGADEYIWFVSPYIKLHERIKLELKKRKDDYKLQIIIVFGKNEYNPEKSISPEDIHFLSEFPDILICYEKNLHAKYYASDKFSMLTSMNLHEYSHNNNVEAAVVMYPRSNAAKLADAVVSSENPGRDAFEYFDDIIENSELLFKKVPQYESGFLGLTKKYTHSEIEINKLTEFFDRRQSDYKTPKENSFSDSIKKTKDVAGQKPGYCIRSGVPIPFNALRPYSYEAYQIWMQFENQDYPEKFCHLTGKPSYGKTSMRKPIL
jgi:hypothetical protein